MKQAYYHYRKDNSDSSSYQQATYKFAAWELQYMLEWFEKNKFQLERYGSLLIERIFSLFVECCRKNCHDSRIGGDDEILSLQKRLKTFVEKQDYGLRMELYRIYLFPLFLENLELFCRTVERSEDEGMKELVRFRDHILNQKKVVIFGSGERGQALLAVLLRNGYQGGIAFCDNNREKWDTEFMGYKIGAVEAVCRNSPDACFLIAADLFYAEMKRQLLDYGISMRQIVLPPYCTMHSCMEMDWGESKDILNVR